MPSSDCPDRPQTEEDLGFVRESMVRWFHPIELVRTGTEAVLSGLFGAYADWREVQALRAHDQSLADADDSRILKTIPREGGGATEWYDLSNDESIWIDYTADLGDGFEPTYTVARLLAERDLEVDGHKTGRGQLFVMGGDQVYPAASRDAYRNRLVGPFRAALPCVTDEEPPYLFAVPGNHDWYDGLTSFLRLFTQQRWIGGWQTQQRRSYFAIKLPHDWWLWGIDVQLGSDIDQPQLDYFRSIASTESVMPAGSKIVLCTAEPSWVYAESKGAHAYHNLAYFQHEVIDKYDHEMEVGLAGDLHTYARYADAETDKQRFIAGGGGAYLYPTHTLPERLDIETLDGNQSSYQLEATHADGKGKSLFPSRQASRRLTWGALGLPFKNGWFGGLVAVLYLLFAWLLESSTAITAFPADGSASTEAFESLLQRIAQNPDVWSGVCATAKTLKHTPSAVVLVIILWFGFYKFADLQRWYGKLVVGTLHTGAHLLLAVGLMVGFANLNARIPGLALDGFLHALLFTIEMLLLGGLLGGILVGLYLVLTNRLLSGGNGGGVHTNEVFSAQHIPDYKSVVRLRVVETGELTIYPLGVPDVETEWSLRPDGRPQDPWLDCDGDIADRAVLIEPPISV